MFFIPISVTRVTILGSYPVLHKLDAFRYKHLALQQSAEGGCNNQKEMLDDLFWFNTLCSVWPSTKSTLVSCMSGPVPKHPA
jgi:hypothetical protein